MKLICLACSATKRPDAGMMPAYDRYDGPMWRTLRAALGPYPHPNTLQIWFLSARYGFQPARLPIPNYDQRLSTATTSGNADGFARCVRSAEAVLFAGGEPYRSMMREAAGPNPLIHTATAGGIGYQRAQLKAWIAEHCA